MPRILCTAGYSKAFSPHRIRAVIPILLLVFLATMPLSRAVAGPNQGGVLVVHTNDEIVYTEGGIYGGESAIACSNWIDCPNPYDCSPNVHRLNPTSGLGDQVVLWWILAAFPENVCPQLKGTEFSLSWPEGAVEIFDWGNSADFEVVSAAWPYGGTGESVGVAWRETQRSQLVEIYWFAGVASDGPAVIEVMPHWAQGAYFGDDSTPSVLDRIEAHGSLGLNGAQGWNPPVQGPPSGACCVATGACIFGTEAECVLQGGQYMGTGVSCLPHPCDQPPPPTLRVLPAIYRLDLVRGERKTCLLEIHNEGSRQLSFDLESSEVSFQGADRHWIQGALETGTRHQVTFDIETEELALGIHIWSLGIRSNDPERPEITIPIHLRVREESEPITTPTDPPTYFRTVQTGLPGAVIVRSIDDGSIAIGDEIAIFAGDQVVGSVRYDGSDAFSITIWQEDEFYGLPGVRVGDELSAKTWSPRAETRRDIAIFSEDGGVALFRGGDSTPVTLGDPTPYVHDPESLNEDIYDFRILSVFPNPARSQTDIRYELRGVADVRADIYDSQGRLIRSLHQGRQTVGTYSILWDGTGKDGRPVGSGVYFIRIGADERVAQKRITMLR